MKKLKVIIVDETTLRLEEKGEVGDIIDLRALESVDNSSIIEAIEFKKDKIYNDRLEKEKQLAQKQLEVEITKEKNEQKEKLNKEIQDKNLKIRELELRLESINTEFVKDREILKNDITKDLSEKFATEKEKLSAKTLEQEKAIRELQFNLEKKQSEIKEIGNKHQFELETKIKEKNDQIEYYKNLKSKLNNKLIGETLEQHCAIEFNKLRATAFKRAYFEKDNKIVDDTKGDYVFRDYAGDGETEVVSIMFEMKNEIDDGTNKQTNEKFLEKLHKDRINKKCEYAVLVSLLEIDNELYNQGIVDMSHKYDKMYVIRPQFFIPLITILRDAGLRAADVKQELVAIQNRDIDYTNFENNLNEFKEKFSYNYQLASKKFKTAIEEIDKSIKALEKTKSELLSSENNLRIANDKVDDITIRRLTKNNPTMQKAFDDLKDH